MQEVNGISVSVTLSISKVKELIVSLIKASGINQSIYLRGKSGIGKSAVVSQIAKEMNYEFIDVRLGHYDTVDLNGIGIPNIESRETLFTRPDFYPPADCSKPYLVFLDEFNHASEAVQGMMYQFILERRIGTHRFPKNMLIIGAGNSISDNGIAFSMPSPLVSRFTIINVEPSVEGWLKYAQKGENNIDWRVQAF
ncbi:MAG: AAA domain-containing protein, partial [Candidatus Scalindua sp.]|nr:AAA domain-containing protein [Candidatus Scalindua sp.]